jgi:hypothetical protein
MTAKKTAPCPQPDALTECVQLVEKYVKTKDENELPPLRMQIAAILPEARKLCLEVGEVGEVEAAFQGLEAGLSKQDDTGWFTRHQKLREPHGRIACWENFRRRLLFLRALKQSTGDPIAAFVRFATEVLHLADDVCQWFPERQPTREELEGAAWFCCPKERGLFSEELAPRVTRDLHTTLYFRAVQASRERGEAPFAIPKLERLDKALKAVAGLLRKLCVSTSIIATPAGMELMEAVNEAVILVERKSKPKPLHSAEEACKRLGKEWATAKELGAIIARSDASIRSTVNRQLKKLGGHELGAFKSLNVRPFPTPGPGMPKQEYRIVGIWPLLVPEENS